jgi:hypothetical protein
LIPYSEHQLTTKGHFSALGKDLLKLLHFLNIEAVHLSKCVFSVELKSWLKFEKDEEITKKAHVYSSIYFFEDGISV